MVFETDKREHVELAARVLIRRGCPYFEVQRHGGRFSIALTHLAGDAKQQEDHLMAIRRVIGAGGIAEPSQVQRDAAEIERLMRDHEQALKSLQALNASLNEHCTQVQLGVTALASSSSHHRTLDEALNTGEGSYKP